MTDRKTIICPHCDKAFRLRRSSSPRRESTIDYILANPNADTKEIAEKAGVSLRQAQYYKKAANEIRDAFTKIYFFLLHSPIRSEANGRNSRN